MVRPSRYVNGTDVGTTGRIRLGMVGLDEFMVFTPILHNYDSH